MVEKKHFIFAAADDFDLLVHEFFAESIPDGLGDAGGPRFREVLVARESPSGRGFAENLERAGQGE